MGVEDRMSEKLGVADCELRNADWRLTEIVVGKIADSSCRERCDIESLDVACRGRFVE